MIQCRLGEPLDLSTIYEAYFSVAQDGQVKFEKSLDDGSIANDYNSFIVTLTQEDTLSLDVHSRAFASLRFILRDRTAYANYPLISIEVSDILREGVIS